MAKRQHSTDANGPNRFNFRLSSPVLPQLSLRRIFNQTRNSSSGKSNPAASNSTWRNRLSMLANSDLNQANDGTRSEGGVSQYSGPSLDNRSLKHQSNRSIVKQLPVATIISRTQSTRSSTSNQKQECAMCFQPYSDENSRQLTNCDHKFCLECLLRYVTTEVSEGRANLSCPEPACQTKVHPTDVAAIVGLNTPMYKKYEEFLLRRCLMADPDTRWCPAPDCGFAVIATGCAECPQLRCERPGCGSLFCYHCKQIWHPNLTCEVARVRRTPAEFNAISIDVNKDEIKSCPRCGVFILKADDGSCNHMSCRLCGAEFCWLCMKLVTDVHYLSPSGCTFWGKKRWSKKKKLFWQLGLLAGAPVGIVLLTAIAVPAIMAGFPIWSGRKIRQKHRNSSKAARNAAITGGVVGAAIAAPAIAAAAVGVGVPVLLAYVYGVVPVSLCRSGSAGAKESMKDKNADKTTAADAVFTSINNNPASPMVSVDHSQMLYADKASNVAMAGTLSIASVEAAISGELNSQPDPGSWHLSVDTAGCGESDGNEERVTLDSFQLPRHIVLCDKPVRCENANERNSGDDPAGTADPGSIGSSFLPGRLLIHSVRGESASSESIGASYGCHSDDRCSGVLQLDSASASVHGLTGSVSKLTTSTSNSGAAPRRSSAKPLSSDGHRLSAENALSTFPSSSTSPVETNSSCQHRSFDCEIVCHDPPTSST